MVHVLEAVQFGTVRYLRGIVRHVDAEHVVVPAPEGSGRYFDRTALDTMRADGARIVFVPMRRSPVAPATRWPSPGCTGSSTGSDPR